MLALLWLLAAAPPEVVLARGGEIDGPPAQTTATEGVDTVAWGFTEVPPASRLQAAFALSDANARAEIVKLVRVRVEDMLRSRSTATTEVIESTTREIARGLLPALPLAQHGWRRLQRGDERVLQVWSRLAMPTARLEALLAQVKP